MESTEQLVEAPADTMSTTTASTSTTDPTTPTTFVDYRRPPSVQILPPSKYKLWLLVFVLVYFAVWVGEAANFWQALRFRGWLSPHGAQFLELAIVVFVLTYGALDWVVAMGTVTFRDQPYGLGPWLKCGSRIQWIRQSQYADFFLLECLNGAIQILEEGFGMFNATASPAPATYQKRMKRVGSAGPDDDSESPGLPYTCDSDSCRTVVKIEHRLNPNKMKEYQKWTKRIERAAKHANGLISVNSMDVIAEEIDPTEYGAVSDIEQGKALPEKSTSIDTTHSTQETKQPTKSLHSATSTVPTNLHTVFLTFDNIDSLNDWMLSPRRDALMKQLEPLLSVPDQELIQAERAANARDAFTNLTIQQGLSSPKLPPKKWKVSWLTTLALLITVRWVSSFLEYYLEFWGLDEAHPRLRTLVTIFITTFLNSYVTTPFLLFLFHPWMARRPNEVDERPIWKTLDDGTTNIWFKFLLTFAYYGGCAIAWATQTY